MWNTTDTLMDKEHYTFTNFSNSNTNIDIIPIDKIGISLEICDAVKFPNKNIDKDEILSMFPTDHLVRDIPYPLKRMDSIMEALNNDIPLPPISVTRNSNQSYYNILNGRHRMAGSIINGYKNIPVIIY